MNAKKPGTCRERLFRLALPSTCSLAAQFDRNTGRSETRQVDLPDYLMFAGRTTGPAGQLVVNWPAFFENQLSVSGEWLVIQYCFLCKRYFCPNLMSREGIDSFILSQSQACHASLVVATTRTTTPPQALRCLSTKITASLHPPPPRPDPP